MDSGKVRANERKKRVQWTSDAVRFLLQVWRQKLLELENTKRTAPIIEKMSELMINRGFNFSAGEVKVKIHNLKNKFHEERRQIESGMAMEDEWPFYRALDYLMGNRRGYEWKDLMIDCADPLYDYNEELTASRIDDIFKEDGELSEFEENNIQGDPIVIETHFPSTSISSSEVEVYDEQSESEPLQNLKASEHKQDYIETKPKIIESDGFRIIADNILPRKKPSSNEDISSRNGIWPQRTSKANLKISETDKPNFQYLNLAKLELIKLQKEQVKQEMNYRSKEFEQKTREHKLRLRHMQEEHELRMKSLRNDSKMNSQETD
ncbi:uncharacterized protein LOC118743273 isoform X2 [Rhagoletis pomonella]|uniref:uncharacterized protein LOC118743273 isoform X2 n=1 Tax=Rhagoletis pomonella TaxID=28610 RepID=UPI001780E631|nr:uncharacterized protein LOC118743273 isoform X2 [Rhagoletis pomonella]